MFNPMDYMNRKHNTSNGNAGRADATQPHNAAQAQHSARPAARDHRRAEEQHRAAQDKRAPRQRKAAPGTRATGMPSAQAHGARPHHAAQANGRAASGAAAAAPANATTSAPSARPRSRYIPALDGIRTLAVLAVVLYHLNLPWAQGGLLGVTVFFVLSGYLITRLLLEEFQHTGSIDLKGFWVRRMRRLMPAIVTVMVVTCALCTIFNHVMLTKMRPDILPSLFFVNNWWQILQNVSYFDALGDPSPLTHFWSLAIEAQFYLVWPPILLLMLKLGVKRTPIRRIVVALAAISALAMALLYNPAVDPSRIYYGTDTRVFSLLLGAWLAFIPERALNPRGIINAIGLGRFLPSRAHEAASGQSTPSETHTGTPRTASRPTPRISPALATDLVGVAGLAGLVLMVVFTNGYTAFPYQGGTLLCTLLTLMLMMAAIQPAGILARALSWTPLVWLGKRSYGIYLWHYPLLMLMNPVADVTEKPWWLLIIQALVVVAAAEISYRFIETPFRHGAFGRFVEQLRLGNISLPVMVRRHMPLVAVCAALAVVALGGLVFVPNTSALSEEGAALLADGAAGNGNTGAEGGDAAANATGEGNAMSGTNASGDADATDDSGFPAGSYDILMVGDSVSLRCVDTFANTFPHGHIDAAKSRQFSAGIETYRGYVDQNLAGKIAVFALGTNGLVTDEQIDELMGLVGSKRVAVFINTRSPQPWVGATNEAIARAAERYDNVHVIDWYGYSANRNDVFDGDGTHLNNKGANEYINLVYDAVKEDLPVHPEDHASDPQPAKVHDALNKVASALAHGFAPHALNPKEGSAA